MGTSRWKWSASTVSTSTAISAGWQPDPSCRCSCATRWASRFHLQCCWTGVGEMPRGREDAGGTGRHTDSPVQTRRTERRHRQQLPQATASAGCSCLYRGSPREGQDVQWVNGWFEFERDKSVYVNHYYFYIDDEDFGPLFIKICSYAPWSMKLCLNGHEWAKRQLEKKKTAYEALDNGFLSCAEPEKLQQICDSLGPEDIDRVFRKWLRRIPLP